MTYFEILIFPFNFNSPSIISSKCTPLNVKEKKNEVWKLQDSSSIVETMRYIITFIFVEQLLESMWPLVTYV